MSQVDRIAFLPMIFWFVIAFIFCYFIIFSYFLPFFFSAILVRVFLFFYFIESILFINFGIINEFIAKKSFISIDLFNYILQISKYNSNKLNYPSNYNLFNSFYLWLFS